jgi:restriction system protein
MARRRRRSRRVRRIRALLALVAAAYLYLRGSGWYDAHRPLVAAARPWVVPALVLVGLAVLAAVAASRTVSARRQAEADRLLATADASFDGRDFEQLVGRLYARDGCTRVQAGGGAGDLGADVVCTAPSGARVVTQCKRYAVEHKVSSPDMQRFLGTVRNVHAADVAVFVTTSWFTEDAAALGRRCGVVLVDRARLAEWQAGRWSPIPSLTTGGSR